MRQRNDLPREVPRGFFVVCKAKAPMKETKTARTLQGIVIKKGNPQITVQVDGRVVICTFPRDNHLKMAETKRSSRHGLDRNSAPGENIVVGDRVGLCEYAPGSGLVTAVLPRTSQFVRRSAAPMSGAYAGAQVIAANVDQVVPVFAAANPEPHWNMLDRYLVAAEAHGLPALICISKADLAGAPQEERRAGLDAELADYRRIGYPVVWVSAVTGAGLVELKAALAGRITLLLGKSGVGKTSLLNAIQPGLGLRVSAVNPVTGKGRHTTTAQEMFMLEGGGAIVDTPGEREFGLWDVDGRELDTCFPEMRPYLGRCRFGLGCQHDEEPGCAVRQAVMVGEISPRRYHSYLRLREDP